MLTIDQQSPPTCYALTQSAVPEANLRFCRDPHVDDRLERQRPKHKVTFSIYAAWAEAGLRPSNKASIREFAHQLLRLDEQLGIVCTPWKKAEDIFSNRDGCQARHKVSVDRVVKKYPARPQDTSDFRSHLCQITDVL